MALACSPAATGAGPHASDAELQPPDKFPPEPQSGAMEYKLHLVEPNQSRLEHLATQMKWRMEEGGGQAIYRLGVTDCGDVLGLDSNAMEKSMDTIYKMAQKLGASVTVQKTYRCGNTGSKVVLELLVRTLASSSNPCLESSVAVLGPVDAGKSTLLGVLTDGQMDNGRGQARLNLLRHRHELLSGRTSSVNHGFLGFDKDGRVVSYEVCENIQEICKASHKIITLIDLAGHQKYLKTTVFGLTAYQPKVAMLVVGTNTKIDQTTHDQVCFSMAMQMPLFVVVTKVDICSRDQLEGTTQAIVHDLIEKNHKRALIVESGNDILTAAQSFQTDSVVPLFHISCVSGHHLDLLQSFLYLLPVQSPADQDLTHQPAEFHVDELFNVHEVGLVLGGILKRGVLREGEQMMVGPDQKGKFLPTTVQSLRFKISRTACVQVRAGQAATITVSSVERSNVRKGTVLLSTSPLDDTANSCLKFEAELSLLSSSSGSFKIGFQSTIFVSSATQNAVVDSIKDKDKLSTGEEGVVCFRFLCHPEYLRVGTHFVLREGPTKGFGKVLKLFPLEPA